MTLRSKEVYKIPACLYCTAADWQVWAAQTDCQPVPYSLTPLPTGWFTGDLTAILNEWPCCQCVVSSVKQRQVFVVLRLAVRVSSIRVSGYKSSEVAEMGDHLATIDMGRKVGMGCCGGRWVPTGSPSNTMWPGQKPTSLPSGILIHPTVWPLL